MRKKSSANLSVDILQYLAHFLYAFLRFDSRSPKQNRLPYRCSVSYSIDASGNLLRKHAAGMFSLRASPVRFPRSENKKTAEWRSFCFGGDEGNLLRAKNMPLACFLYALLRFDSHAPKTKKPPNGGLFVLVETRGIEPLSESTSSRTSPGAVILFKFPPRCAK